MAQPVFKAPTSNAFATSPGVFAANPAAGRGAFAGTKPAMTGKAKPVRVIVHPSGKIEIHHTAAPASVPVASAASSSAPVRAAPTPVVRPKPVPARTPVAAAITPAAPVQTVEQQARALLNPAEKSATDAINQRIAAQQAAIGSSTQTLADLMGKYAPASRAAYAGAQQGQAAVDAATGQTLAGQGQQGEAELAAKLAQISADPGTVARLTGTAAANTTGATGALAARGSASLSDLIARGASAQDYGAKLPGVAGMYGLQSTKAAQAQGTTDTANAIAQMEAKYPDLVQTIKAGNDRTAQLAFENRLAGFKATTAATKTSASAAAAAAKVSRPNSALSKLYGHVVDSNGNTILKNGKPQPISGGASSTKPLSPTILKQAGQDAEDLFHGVTKPNLKDPANPTVVAYSTTYQDAIRTMMGKYPGLGRAGVLALVNRWYPPGGTFPDGSSNGRPRKPLTAQQKQALKMFTGGLISGRR